MASHDWARTPIGDPEGWPVALQVAVRNMLASGEPRSISWGPSLCLLYNDAYAGMMDGRHPEALGRPLAQVWADVWDVISPDVMRALEGSASFRSTVPLTRMEDGVAARRWHTVAYSPLFDDAGAVGGVQCLTINVTERVASEAVRERELRSLRDLFAHAPGFVAVVRGPEYAYVLVNQAYEELVGQQGLIGRSARTVLPELAGQGYFDLLDQVRITGKPFRGHAMPARFAGPDGRPAGRFVDFVFQPILDPDSGAVDCIFIQGSDVTAREQAVRALREDAKFKDQFLAVLAHELRNPLSPIASAGAALVAGCDAARSRNLGSVVQRQAAQLGRIVDDLLDVSHASRGTYTLRYETVDLKAVVESAVEAVAPLLEKKRHDLRLVDVQSMHVDGDSARLTQAVSNLLTNACRYTPDGGRVDVELRGGPEWVELLVRDNGIGIDEAALPRIFELFVQGSAHGAHSSAGLGIGLALVKRLVELHGGGVEASSAGPGSGAEFVVRLPRRRMAPGEPARAATAASD